MSLIAVVVCLSASVAVGMAATIGPPPTPGAAGLPDGRSYEEVSPAEKNGNEAGAKNVPWVYYALASTNGDKVMYGGTGPFGETMSGSDQLSVSTRSDGNGWSTRAVLPSGQGVDASNLLGETPGSSTPAVDFSSFLFLAEGSFAPENPVFGQGVQSEGLNLVSEESGPGGGIWSISWLSRPRLSFQEADPEPGRITITFPFLMAGASPDLRTAYFGYYGTLVTEDASRAPQVNASVAAGPWGFYEWHDGSLVSAAGLPSGGYDPFGALPAAAHAKGPSVAFVGSDDFHNQVSADGTRAFFVSPDPETAHPAGDPTELYLHDSGRSRGILVSRDELAGGAAAPGYVESGETTGVTPTMNPTPNINPASRLGSYLYASADGSRAYFESMDKLAKSVPGAEPAGTGPWTYEFNVATEKVVYLPGVVGPILAATPDASRFIFENSGSPSAIDMWSHGVVSTIATFSAPNNASIAPARSSADGSVFVWETNAELSPGGFNNAGGHQQVYRYDVGEGSLSCVSCPPRGIAPSGDAHLSNDDEQTGNPEPVGDHNQVVGSRGISSDGQRVFFDTPEALVLGDINGQRDVYEWEDNRVYLISSGQSTAGSFFLDNSETGDDVFFTTTESLVERDYDQVYDVYDARVGGGFPPPTPPPAACVTGCQGAPSPSPTFQSPTSVVFIGPGSERPSKATGPAGKRSSKKHAKKMKRKRKKSKKASAGRAPRSSRVVGGRP